MQVAASVMPVDAALQEFDVATGAEKAKKLTTDLSHAEAENLCLGRQCEAVKASVICAYAALFSLVLE